MNRIKDLGPDRGAVPQKDKEQYYTDGGYTSTCLMSILLAKVDGNYIKSTYDLPKEEFPSQHIFIDFEYYLNEEYKIQKLDDNINEILDSTDLNKEYICFKLNYAESPLWGEISNIGIDYILNDLSFLKDFEMHTAESLQDGCLEFNQNELFLCVGVHYSCDYWGESDVDYDIIGYLDQNKKLIEI